MPRKRMSFTLSVVENVVEGARKVGRAMGKSLNQLIRDYLEQVTATGDVEEEMRELRRLRKRSGGRSRGWRFNRDELHERS